MVYGYTAVFPSNGLRPDYGYNKVIPSNGSQLQ